MYILQYIGDFSPLKAQRSPDYKNEFYETTLSPRVYSRGSGSFVAVPFPSPACVVAVETEEEEEEEAVSSLFHPVLKVQLGKRDTPLHFPPKHPKRLFCFGSFEVFCLRGTGAVVAVRKKLGIRLFGKLKCLFEFRLTKNTYQDWYFRPSSSAGLVSSD